MSTEQMRDDNSDPIKNDYRSKITTVLKSAGYSASGTALFDINWLLNQIQASWAEDEKVRAKGSRAQAVITLDCAAKTFRDFAAAWASLTRSTVAKSMLFEVAHSHAIGATVLTDLDATLSNPDTRVIFRALGAAKRSVAAIPATPPGVVPIAPLLPYLKKLLRALQSSLASTGALPRTRVPATHSKRCQITSDLLELCGIRFCKRTLQNNTSGM